MRHQVGLSSVHQIKTGSFLVGSEASQLMSHREYINLTATRWVLADLCGGTGSQGVIRMRPAEIMRPKQTKIWLCESSEGRDQGSALFGYARRKWPLS